MHYYYAYIDGNQEGPFDLNQLVEAGVRPSTYIWCKSMDDWKRADEVEEVRELFRQHLDEIKGNAEQRAAAFSNESDISKSGAQENPEEPDLSDIPISYRRYVRKSGTTPGPSDSLDPDINRPPQISMTLAVISMLICFPPAGIAAVVFTYKSQKAWTEAMEMLKRGDDASGLQRQAHEYARLSKMWLGLTVALGIIAWTLVFSIR